MEVAGKRLDTAGEEPAEESEKGVDTAKKTSFENLEKLCEICESDHVKTAANGLCSECEQRMCNQCFRHHLKVKSCRHHELVDINQSVTPIQRRAENVEKCKRHANEAIKYYCRKHEVVGCGDCMIPFHSTCKPETIKDLSGEFKQNEEFRRIIRKVENLRSDIVVSHKNVQDSKNKNKDMLEKSLKDIQTFRSEINKYLAKAEANIIKEVKDMVRKNDELLTKLEKQCNVVSSKIAEVRQQLDERLYKESALFIQSVDCKPRIIDIERAVSAIQSENITTFKFIPDKQLRGTLTSIFKLGNITKEIESTSAQSATIPQTKEKNVGAAAKMKQTETVFRKENYKGQGQAARIGKRVWPIGHFLVDLCFEGMHGGQFGTVMKLNRNGTVDVIWNYSGKTWPCTLGVEIELD